MVRLSSFEIDGKPYVFPSIAVKVPLRTRLRLRQILISDVQLDLNEVHEPRLYTAGLTSVKLFVCMLFTRVISDCLLA